MLDFHSIADFASRGSHTAENHNYVGGIGFDEFCFWQDNGIFGDSEDYYADFLWTYKEVIEKLRVALTKTSSLLFSKEYRLIEILSRAEAMKVGLAAFAD